MPKILVTKRDGNSIMLDAPVGPSVMEAVRGHGIEDIQAVCGGCASCATCHVYINAAPDGALPAMSDQESDLLDCSSHRRSNSRLCCQIPVSAELDGLAITLAPED